MPPPASNNHMIPNSRSSSSIESSAASSLVEKCDCKTCQEATAQAAVAHHYLMNGITTDKSLNGNSSTSKYANSNQSTKIDPTVVAKPIPSTAASSNSASKLSPPPPPPPPPPPQPPQHHRHQQQHHTAPSHSPYDKSPISNSYCDCAECQHQLNLIKSSRNNNVIKPKVTPNRLIISPNSSFSPVV